MDNSNIKRVLHVTEVLSQAGIESFLMNVYRRIDRNKVQFDFLVLRNENEFFDEEVKKLGGIKYWVHSNKKNTLLRIFDESKQIEKFLKKNPYDIVHIHYTTPLRAPYLHAALVGGASYRIYHSHSAYISGKSKLKHLIYSYMRGRIQEWGTHFFACSHAASRWMYPEDLLDKGQDIVIPPGLEIDKFKYNSQLRKKIRKELGIEDEFVIIHTGRFTEQKNQTFLVRLFSELKKTEPNSKLLLSGIGPMQEEVKELTKQLGVEEEVIFLDVKPEIYPYLDAADVYVMPSLYEGLPLAAVEAQCSSLPCIMSDLITEEVALTENVDFLSLNDSTEKWISAILKYRYHIRKDESVTIKKCGYDIDDISKKMEQFYISGEWK